MLPIIDLFTRFFIFLFKLELNFLAGCIIITEDMFTLRMCVIKMKELIQQMSEFELGLNVTITGITLVFAMLILLVLVLVLFGKISVLIKNSKDKKSSKNREDALASMSSNNVVEKVSQPVSDTIDNNNLSEEVVAAISAAVSYIYMGSNKKVVIKSIRKNTTHRRSEWAYAGIIDNTRAF